MHPICGSLPGSCCDPGVTLFGTRNTQVPITKGLENRCAIRMEVLKKHKAMQNTKAFSPWVLRDCSNWQLAAKVEGGGRLDAACLIGRESSPASVKSRQSVQAIPWLVRSRSCSLPKWPTLSTLTSRHIR